MQVSKDPMAPLGSWTELFVTPRTLAASKTGKHRPAPLLIATVASAIMAAIAAVRN